jgi:hypothetical protein
MRILILLLSSVLFASVAFAAAEDTCILSPPESGPASVSDDFMKGVVQEIQEGCGALMMTYPGQEDGERKREKKALNECCSLSNKLLKDMPKPCSDDTKLRYQLNLAFQICDKISAISLNDERQACFTRMASEIKDSRIQKLEYGPDGCLAAAHKKVDGYQQFDAGLSTQVLGQLRVNSYAYMGMQNDIDYGCEYKKLKTLLKSLGPAQEASCPNTQSNDSNVSKALEVPATSGSASGPKIPDASGAISR